MELVKLAIGDVVEDVDSAGEKRKHHERFDRQSEIRSLKQILRENQRSENEEILEPLFWTQESDHRAHDRFLSLGIIINAQALKTTKSLTPTLHTSHPATRR